jgi:predicted HAD superfamily Cof-like phosphohydrolase
MTKQQQDVKTFMQTFGQATPTSPTVPDEKTRVLRVKLLLEEVLELAEASGVMVCLKLTDEQKEEIKKCKKEPYTDFAPHILTQNLDFCFIKRKDGKSVDLVGVADALADIDYVNQGAAVAYGLDLEPFQDEVHSSNMTKLWKLEEVSGTPALNIIRVPDKGDGRVCIVRNADGKVLKSPSYRPANLAGVLAKQQS